MSEVLISHCIDLQQGFVDVHDTKVFRLSFYWTLGYNLSLLILWMTFWGFGFKNYDVN